MKKVLITGGAGYLGSVLTEVLLGKDYQVTILDNLIYKQTSVAPFAHHPNFDFVFGDVTNESLLKSLVEKHDVIIPLAAIVGMPACKAQPELTVKVNYEQVKNITKWITKDQKVIIPNTNSQYGSSTEIITEDSPFKPLSLYAETKCNAEKAVLDSGNGITLRLATVFGMSPRMRIDLLVNDLTYKSLTEGYAVVYESHFMRTFIHVRDIARVFLFSIENKNKMKNNIFNVGSDNMNFSKKDVCEIIKKEVPTSYFNYADVGEDADKRNYQVSYDKIKSLGFKTEISLEEGIRELIKVSPLIKTINPYYNVVK